MNKPFVVGLTGGSGAGKTHFLSQLMKYFTPKEVCLISQDNYYHPREAQPLDEKGFHNFDTPLAIDFKLLASDIQNLVQGHEVRKEEYTFNNPGKKPALLIRHPAPIVIVEGIFVLYHPEIANLLDLKIFLEAKDHIKLSRRIVRDKEERGYGLEDVLYRYINHVAPTYEKYIEPFKTDADVIIPNHLHFEKALEMIVQYLKQKIGNKSL